MELSEFTLQALLSEASYIDFESARLPDGTFDANLVRDLMEEFNIPTMLAKEFEENWEVWSQQPDTFTSGGN